MKWKWIFAAMSLVLLLSACEQGPAVTTTEPSVPVTTVATTVAPTTQPTEESTTAPSEGSFSLADLELNDLPSGGLSPEPFRSFIYEADMNFRSWGDVVEQAVADAELKEGFLYRVNTETGEIILLLDQPVLARESISKYIFCITANNTLVLTDHAGELYHVLYEAQTQLQPDSLNYWKKTLYFIDGAKIINFDLMTGLPTVLFEYEGAIDADPLYGIDHKFPHLLCIKTATEDVACNLETGETAIIPETGDNGTTAFELFMEYGTWPEEVAT